MKKTKFMTVLLAFMVISGAFTLSANAVAFPSLPGTPVTISVNTGADTYPLAIVLSGVPAGFDVLDGAYVGWCFSLLEPIVPFTPINPVTLSASFTDFNEINYLLNHEGSGTPHDVQAAIWIIQGFTTAEIATNAGGIFNQGYDFSTAIALANAAVTNGASFVPGPGEIVAVECIAPAGTQDVLIQLTVPGLAPGFTPGFWKHDIQVRLSHAPYDEGLTVSSYNAFSGGPRDGEKLTDALMDSLLAIVNTMPGFTTLTFDQALANLQLQGNNPLRTATANAFNAAAGYGPF